MIKKMIIVNVEKDGLDKALKKFKKKFEKTGILKELKRRKEYTKPSVERRKEVKKAIYVEQKFNTPE